ncbi:MAG TPA: hypothetical protein VFB68_15020 [Xanthobacteraceae bacterium]|nr:hypothetical protein [Xanthobacteraceae bacterium]
MSDVVSNDELNALAAEYVLGTLDYEERKGANALLEVDPTFRGIVRIWERRFGDLHLMVESVEPDPQLWVRIKPKMGGIEQIAPAIPSSAEVPAAAAAATSEFEAVAGTPPAEPASSDAPAAAPEAVAVASVPEGSVAAEPKTEAVAAPADGAAPAGTEPAAAETPPAEVQLAGTEAPAVAEAELKLAELAALLPVAPEQRHAASAGQPATPSAIPEAMPEDGLHTHAPDLVPRGFVPPAPMTTRGTPIVVEKPVRKSARGWAAATLTMALIAVALAGLISAWRFFPERLPPQLRATTVLNLTASPQAPGPKARPKLAPFDE